MDRRVRDEEEAYSARVYPIHQWLPCPTPTTPAICTGPPPSSGLLVKARSTAVQCLPLLPAT
eukprot:3759815-Rhodomonas_salina.2